jgi:SAM-dependent methyltransferase
MRQFAARGVDLRIEDATGITQLGFKNVDLVFASNFMEHLDQTEFSILLPKIHDVLKPQGKLVLLQPNYRLYPERYFDDKTHKTIFSDENISGFLEGYGFVIRKLIPGLLPFSMKSRLPKWSFLVRLYLLSPVRPMAGQMYVVAERR